MKCNLRIISFQIVILLSVLTCASNVLSAENSKENKPALTIAVASNFHFPLSILIKESDYWATQPIRLVSASSGTLYAQITKGAPFDLFFSADSKRPQSLAAQSLGLSPQSYAQGKLVLWPIPADSSQQYYNKKSIALPGKLAIANPQLAPFGLAASAYISTLSNADSLMKKLVLGASVTQAFQFVDSGNAELGLLAESTLKQAMLVQADKKYSQYMLIPIEDYPAITQQVVIVSRSANKVFAQKFIDFVLSELSQKKLSTLGYIPVSEPT